MDENDLVDTVAAFYDGAAGPELWQAAGEKLSRVLNAERAVVRFGPRQSGAAELVITRDIPEEVYIPHFTYYHTVDPYLVFARSTTPATTPTARRKVLLSEDIICEADLRRTEYYGDYARQRGLVYGLFASSPLSGDAMATLSSYRPESMAPFGEEERRAAISLVPHLWCALELRQRLRPRHQAMAGLGALDTLPQGVVVADGDSRVTFANAAARRLAEAADGGLRLVRQGPLGQGGLLLSAAHRADAAALAKVVAAVARLGSPGGTLRLRRAGGQPSSPLAALVCPLPAWLATAGARQGVAPGLALVIVTDPARPSPPDAAMLSGVFGLSPGEADVASSLAGGRSAEEVARLRGVGLETVRTQVRAVLAKTGAANLRDLERMLALLQSAYSPRP